MKYTRKKWIALILAGLMLLPLASCANGDTSDNPKDTATGTEGEEDTGYKPDIERKDYDCDFVITGVGDVRDWALADEDSAGDPLEDAIYERSIKIKDHLGVTITELDAGDWIAYAGNVLISIQAGDDDYQLVATSTYQGVVELMSSGAMYDFAEFEAVDLEAPYWAFEYMDGLTIQDKYYLGYNDFCLSNTFCMVLNKDLMAEYNLTEPYEDVRNKKWTLDKLTSYVSTVSRDNGDNIWDENDTYGITGWGWTDFIAFVQASDLRIVDRDEDDVYQIAYDMNQEKTLSLLDKVSKLYNADYGYFWTPFSEREGKTVSFGSGRTLIQTMNTSALPGLRGETVRFGVLPYPLYDERQEAYKNLNWNGNIMVPSSIRNPDMVGETIELLAYYTAPVKTAYFEDLLGSKLAEAPDDAEMLDIIWDSIVSDAGVITSNISDNAVDYFLYLVPKVVRDGTGTYASYVKARLAVANKGLDKFFNPPNKR
ncbi:MAG: carbohydrate ABC transporter substrate-binding protein [Ruminococcaceae bacterium]|nr:carbohydrate ABC transporter substrate-binding protein [Oscillospiraceae bacterium]